MRKSVKTSNYVKTMIYNQRDLPLDAEFSAVKEARSFLSLVFRGEETYEGVRHTILMTNEQLRELVAEGCGDSKLLAAIQQRRAETWQCFRRMFLAAQRRPIAA